MKKFTLVLVLLVALIAVVPTFAGDDTVCDEQFPEDTFPLSTEDSQVPGGTFTARIVPAGNYNKIIVNRNCYLAPGVIVNGNVIEPDNDEDYSIYVDPQATVKGNIKETGRGDVRLTVGQLMTFRGTIREKGPGNVLLWIDGFFTGTVEEQDDGNLRIDVFGDDPDAGPGTYNGNAVEMDVGDACLVINELGVYNGNFRQQGEGEIYFSDDCPQP
jgi:hypothetical protein